ncbi:MAG: endoglucanase, partial [Actinomycetota bacterium]
MKVFTLVGSRRGRIAFAATTALALVVGVGLPRISAQAAGGTVNVNPSPTFQNNNANVTEGNFGTASVNVTFALSQDNANQVTVHYTTADGTATAPGDYVAQSGDVVFAPHETSKNVVFNAKGDTIDEANENFKVQIGTITQTGPDSFTKGSDGTVTILDDDAAPGMSVPDVAVNEGTDGSPGAAKTKMTFTAHLSSPAGSDQTFYVFTGNPTRDSDPNTSGVQPHRAAT